MPPVSSRSARSDAQYLNDEAGTPADSTVAAHSNDRDFGTSRWQLSINATRNCCGEGGGSWARSGHRADTVNVSLLTHHDISSEQFAVPHKQSRVVGWGRRFRG